MFETWFKIFILQFVCSIYLLKVILTYSSFKLCKINNLVVVNLTFSRLTIFEYSLLHWIKLLSFHTLLQLFLKVVTKHYFNISIIRNFSKLSLSWPPPPQRKIKSCHRSYDILIGRLWHYSITPLIIIQKTLGSIACIVNTGPRMLVWLKKNEIEKKLNQIFKCCYWEELSQNF